MENRREELQKNIAKNIQYYRKQLNLTQLELAEILNYSDKSISKWERGEGIPDVFVLNKLAEFFHISINDLLSEKTKKIKKPKQTQLKPLIYVLIVWADFTIAYGLLKMFYPRDLFFPLWHLFIYPIPISGLIFFIFNLVWKKLPYIYLFLTVFIWGSALSLQLLFTTLPAHLFYIITTALYLLFMYITFYTMQYRKKRRK
ncbi:MAG: helix-turn-helix domain-containing protein [Acholeplasmataceae bacterium]|jgi:transcriptional regulator with XRE-family HTH domain|nr:helix-turn-helix domain-containing protein [Acholeplasmataceae bacterium]